jgi:molybdopterin molybdotransferase
MKRFFRVKTVDAVLELINGFTPLEPETVGLSEALNRVAATDVRAGEDVPGFSRSTMDGYAVRARDPYGASEGMPALFEVAGEV